MFNFHDFVFQTVAGMIGIEPEYKVRQYALGWVEKSVLTQSDLEEIEDLLDGVVAEDETIEQDN